MLTALVLLLQVSVSAARPVVWDYSDADLKTGLVNRFELSIDGGAFVDVGRVRADDADQTPGTVSYKTSLPPLMVGPHTVDVRACNVTECSPVASFAFVVSITPAKVSNLRIGGGK
jgi:hypothetical protein